MLVVMVVLVVWCVLSVPLGVLIGRCIRHGHARCASHYGTALSTSFEGELASLRDGSMS